MGFQLENISKKQKLGTEQSDKISFLQKEITIFGYSFSNKINTLLKQNITFTYKCDAFAAESGCINLQTHPERCRRAL